MLIFKDYSQYFVKQCVKLKQLQAWIYKRQKSFGLSNDDLSDWLKKSREQYRNCKIAIRKINLALDKFFDQKNIPPDYSKDIEKIIKQTYNSCVSLYKEAKDLSKNKDI